MLLLSPAYSAFCNDTSTELPQLAFKIDHPSLVGDIKNIIVDNDICYVVCDKSSSSLFLKIFPRNFTIAWAKIHGDY